MINPQSHPYYWQAGRFRRATKRSYEQVHEQWARRRLLPTRHREMYERALRGELIDPLTRQRLGISGLSAHAYQMLAHLLSIARSGGLIRLDRGYCTLQEQTGRGEHAVSEGMRELLGEAGTAALLHWVGTRGRGGEQLLLQIVEPLLVEHPEMPENRSLAQMRARREAARRATAAAGRAGARSGREPRGERPAEAEPRGDSVLA